MSPAKTGEPIDITFVRETRVGQGNHVSDWGRHWTCTANTMDGLICAAAAAMRALATITVATVNFFTFYVLMACVFILRRASKNCTFQHEI